MTFDNVLRIAAVATFGVGVVVIGKAIYKRIGLNKTVDDLIADNPNLF